MLHQAAICRAYFTDPLLLANGRGSALVSELLCELAGERICTLEIERSDGRFSLAIDADWADLGLQVSGLLLAQPGTMEDHPLPRTVLHAVIAGWPQDWDAPTNPRISLHLSDDMIPHVSIAELDIANDSSRSAHTTA